MDKENSALNQFLEETQSDNLFATPPIEESVPPVEDNPKEEEKPLPFHKDPKVQRYIERELDKRLSTFKPEPVKTQETDDEFKDVMDSFTAAIGNDTPEKVHALNGLQKALTSLDTRAANKAEEKINEIRRRDIKEDTEAEEQLHSSLESIEENFDVDLLSDSASARKTREEFLTFVEKIAPKDRQGNIIDYPDMHSTFETFSEMKKTPPSRAKEIAARSMARSSETQVQQPKKVDWNTVEDYIDTLK